MFSIVVNFVGLVLSLFLGSLLLSSRGQKKQIYFFNGLLLLVFSIFILNSLRILTYGPSLYSELELLSNYLIFLVGPLLFIIIKLETPNYKFSLKDRIHFYPFIIIFISGFLLRNFANKNYINIIDTVFGIGLLVLLSAYLAYSLYYILSNKIKLSPPTKYAFYGFVAVWHFNLLFQFISFTNPHVHGSSQIWATLILSILVVILSYTHWIEIIKELNPIKSKLKISQKAYEKIITKLDDELINKKSYLDKNFSLQQLSQSINEPSSYISKIINEEEGVSFPIYIAKLRIQEFKRIALFEENQHLTIKGIAEKVGFKSSSTFNKAFKKHSGMLPSEFMKTMEKS